MTRQPPPVLTRQSIVRAALELMDRDGWAAFSLPRLSKELGIQTPSLYHHFRDRNALLTEVARTVVNETPKAVIRPGAPWTEYFIDLCVNFRRTILRHPTTAPVLLQFLPRDVMTPLYDLAARQLADVRELPLDLHVVVLDGLEKLTLGAALVESASGADTAFRDVDPLHHPQLAAAAAANAMDSEELFIAIVHSFLDGIVLTAAQRSAPSRLAR